MLRCCFMYRKSARFIYIY